LNCHLVVNIAKSENWRIWENWRIGERPNGQFKETRLNLQLSIIREQGTEPKEASCQESGKRRGGKLALTEGIALEEILTSGKKRA
jgi:hypothetical protein